MSRKHIAQQSKIERENKKLNSLISKYEIIDFSMFIASFKKANSIFYNQISLSLNGENTQ